MNSQAFDREAEDAHRLAPDEDPQETREWMQALSAVITTAGPGRAHYLLEQLLEHARQHSIDRPFSANTAYVNTLEPEQEAHCASCNMEIEMRLRAYARWNAMMMVVRANRLNPPDGGELGGHIGSYASVASMFSAGFNHFWHAETPEHGGDCLYIQGHSAPGIYARAFLEGRLSEEQLDHFRQETGGKGLSSYPHPMLMPHFWQFPTVSMGLGPLMAIYQARFLKYLHARGIADTANRKVWAFCGDGEMDEIESMGAIGMAARETLDNLIFVINCNLQRLDGPVRGNGKIIQELEGDFRGSGWNVIKLIWGSNWDPLLARDTSGKLRQLMMEMLDGDYQAYKANDGAFVREHFFNRYPETAALVAHMSDEEVWELRRGGHDARKVYAAFDAAHRHRGQPTVVLVKTVKGYGIGKAGEGKNTVHQLKKLSDADIRTFRDRFNIPVPDSELEKLPYYRPAADTPEMQYLHARRKALGGYVPSRRPRADESMAAPPLEAFRALLEPTAPGREISTTQAFVRFLNQLLRDPVMGPRAVPILVDEARTFGMEGLFRQIGIYNPKGQLYTPVDKDQVMYYKEAKDGQILQEGINEAGAWPAGLPQPRATARPTASWCRSTCSTRCSASSAWATWPGQPATCAPAAFCWAAPAGAPPSTARACNTRTATATSWRAPFPTVWLTIPPSPTKWPSSCGMACTAWWKSKTTCFTTSRCSTKTTPCPACSQEPKSRSCRACTGVRQATPAWHCGCSCWAAAASCANAWPPRPCWPRTGASAPTSGVALASTNWRAKDKMLHAGTCCTRPASREQVLWPANCRNTPARSWRPPIT